MKTSLRILVSGLIAQHPKLGGMSWHYLQFVSGLHRLGHDVFYIEDSGEWPYNLDGGLTGSDYSSNTCVANIRYLQQVMQSCGLDERWAYRCPVDATWSGPCASNVADLVASADLLINVSGTLARPQEYRGVPVLAYIDTDPVFTQIRLLRKEAGFTEAVNMHDRYFSFGQCLPGVLPATGHRWLPTRQPVLMDAWRASEAPRNAYTTVMNWASYACEEFGALRFGQKDIEFAKFLDLPSRVPDVRLEIAVRGTRKGHLPGHDESREPEDLLRVLTSKGWAVVDAIEVCASFEDYRQHIQNSRAEWSIAKNAYVAGKAGWFSDRSACYLAAGRPAVLQDTGFQPALPVGEGLLVFSDIDEAAEAIRRVESDHSRHSRAARAIAEQFFNSDKVLSNLLEQAFAQPAETAA